MLPMVCSQTQSGATRVLATTLAIVLATLQAEGEEEEEEEEGWGEEGEGEDRATVT